MEKLGAQMEQAEEEMLRLSSRVKPTRWGIWLGPYDAAAVSQLLIIGALAVTIVRLNCEEKELTHLRATLKEEDHARSD